MRDALSFFFRARDLWKLQITFNRATNKRIAALEKRVRVLEDQASVSG